MTRTASELKQAGRYDQRRAQRKSIKTHSNIRERWEISSVYKYPCTRSHQLHQRRNKHRHHKKLKRLWQRKKSKSRPSKRSSQSTLRPPTPSRVQSSVTTKRRRRSRNRSSSIPSAPSTVSSRTSWITFAGSAQKRNELSSVSSTWRRLRRPTWQIPIRRFWSRSFVRQVSALLVTPSNGNSSKRV